MRYALALALAGMVSAPCVAQAQPAAAQDREVALTGKVAEALGLIREKKPAEALAILDPVLLEYEKLFPAAKGKVRCTNDEAAAGKRQGDVTLIANAWCYGLWAKGYVLVEMNRLQEAVAPAARAAALMPDNPQFLSELGYIHQSLKQFDLSLAAYESAAKAAASIADEGDRKFELRRAWFGIGYDYVELGRLDDAEASLKKALEVAPGDQKILDELEYVRKAKAKAKPG
ncbi:tetratricopeptide repeat protein [Sphingomonas soli]|uniref:tetratricopeptide repeat protein n=1 Tax=Sphingomonas soli TaxID=266127 RepID=UPI00082A872C|nr:tetratricopeptide repeat protein [Sphingomonas soli]